MSTELSPELDGGRARATVDLAAVEEFAAQHRLEIAGVVPFDEQFSAAERARVAPLDFDDRTFFMIDGAGLTRIAVKDRAGDWVVAQYPESAGFQTPDMVAYLDAVRPLAGSMSAR